MLTQGEKRALRQMAAEADIEAARRVWKSLTRAQKAIIEDARRQGGKIRWGARSNAGGAIRRMCERLKPTLLIEGPPWQITDLAEDILAIVRPQ